MMTNDSNYNEQYLNNESMIYSTLRLGAAHKTTTMATEERETYKERRRGILSLYGVTQINLCRKYFVRI